jgi:drug/metabolite transporter (DMT)-like permease
VSNGAWTRVIRSRLFQQHNPEMFALYASMVIVLLCSAMVACVVPTTLHPARIPACPFVIALLICIAIGHYHRRVS